jgi:hypothetical protein
MQKLFLSLRLCENRKAGPLKLRLWTNSFQRKGKKREENS